MLTVLLLADKPLLKPGCEDSLRRCLDSANHILATQNIAQNQGLTTANWIAICAIGIPVIIAILAGIGKLLYKSGTLTETVEGIKVSIGKIEKLTTNIPSLEAKVDLLWQAKVSVSNSPVALNDYGNKILESSGIKKIVEDRFQSIVSAVKNMNPKNSYEVQEHIQHVIANYQNDPSLKQDLEIGAFNSGSAIIVVLYVGAIYIRDRVLKELNSSVADIDKFDPAKAASNP